MAEQKNYLARNKINVLAKNPSQNALLDGLRSDPINRMRGYVASSMSHVPYRNPINAPEISLGDVARQAISFAPGIGDLQSGAEALDYAQQGRPVMAGMAGLGALPFVPAIAGIFAGKGAKTANNALLAAAEKMKAAGETDEAIYKATGWFFGMPDKQPRFEIPDDAAGLSRPLEMGRNNIALSKGFNHPEVYKAYPDVKKISYVPTTDSGIHGAYRNTYEGGFLGENIKISESAATDARSTTLHELQHAIQQREGFARGGSPDMFVNDLPDEQAVNDAMVMRALIRSRGIPKENAPAEFLNIMGRDSHPGARLLINEDDAKLAVMTPKEQYKRLAGEAEARLVQARMKMTPAERAASYPPSMFDVPVNEQIIRMK